MDLLPSMPEMYYEISECIKLLITKGCNVNMPNEKSRTPFFILLKHQPKLIDKFELVDFILNNCEVDLYTYKSKEMLKMFKENNPQREVPKQAEKLIDCDFMLSLLRAGKENEFSSSFKNFKEIFTNKNNENSENSFKEVCQQLLYTSVEMNLENAAEIIMNESTVDVNLKPKNCDGNYTPLQLACLHGNHKILELLITRSNDKVKLENGKNLLHLAAEHFSMDPNRNEKFNYQKCFDIALKHCDVNEQDEQGNSPLHYAAKYHNDEAVLALLRHGSYIGIKNNFNEMPLEEISSDAFQEYLDECITTIERPHGDEKQEIVINYKFLKPPNGDFGEEIAPLEKITKIKDLRPLIQHPVLSSFLFLKWSKFRSIFYINLIGFLVFTLSLISFIFLSQQSPDERSDGFYLLAKGVSIIGLICLLLREVFQFVLSPKVYCKSFINWFEILFIIAGFYVLFGTINYDETFWKCLFVFIFFFTGLECLQLIASLPHLNISVNMVILKTVSWTFIKAILPYSLILLLFALGFNMLFSGMNKDKEADEDPFNSFQSFGMSMLKTIVMLTGEMDASSMSLDKHGFAICLFFVLFVFIIPIILFNLMNALAIDDVQEIKKQGELIDLCEKIHALSKYEGIIVNGSNFKLKKFISLFPFAIREGKIVIHPNNRNQIFVYKQQEKEERIDLSPAIPEMQNLTNGKKKKDQLMSEVTLEKMKQQLDSKIVKQIRVILQERKSESKEKIESQRIQSMESEIKLLKLMVENSLNEFKGLKPMIENLSKKIEGN
jgi:ankyrin repeat protein